MGKELRVEIKGQKARDRGLRAKGEGPKAVKSNLCFIFWALVFGLLLSMASSFAQQGHDEAELPDIIHLIQKGDTLWDLAILYYGDASFAAFLADYNNITDVRRIPVGMEIKIPHAVDYKIRRGDTLSEISQEFLGTWKKYVLIAEYNGILDPDFILAGQNLKIPLPSKKPTKPEPEPRPAEAEKPAETPVEGAPVQAPESTEVAQPPAREEPQKPTEEKVPEPIVEQEPSPPKVEEPVSEGQAPIAVEKEVSEEAATEEKKPEVPPEVPVETEKPEPAEKAPEPIVEQEPSPPKVEEPVSEGQAPIAVEKEVSEEAVTEEKKPEVPPEVPVETEKPEPGEVAQPAAPEPVEVKKPETPILTTPPARRDLLLTEVKEPEPQIPGITTDEKIVPRPEAAWPPEVISPWAQKEIPSAEISEPDRLSAILGILSKLERAEADKDALQAAERDKERGVKLPMQSLLQVNGYKSITVQYNKTHYFGKSDVNRYKGYYSGGVDSSYYDYDYSSGYNSSYGSYGYDNSYGYSGYSQSGYGSSGYYGGYGGYGGYMGGRDGPNIEQEFDIHIHGRVGLHTHVDVDYNDTGRSQFGGMGQKEQTISVWYEGDPESIIQRASFGDIQLNLPSSRFINMSRSLFGVNLVAQLGDVRLTAFGTRTKGIKETWTSRGQSRRAGGGTGNRIMDVNYIKERYYAINIGEDDLIHDSYLPIETGSEKIYIDDGIGTNNDSGISTALGYFDYQYPGEDYNVDYTTGQIEFLKNVSTGYKIVVAYKYRGDGGGIAGNPDDMFADDDKDGVVDELDDQSDPVGYVVIKKSGEYGSELRNVYSLGNRNIGRRDFNLSVWREGATDSFKADEGNVAYTRIFGLDSDNDGLVDPELIDFEKGILTFRSPTPFIIDDPNSPYYKYRNELNNEAIYSENPRYTDQKYVIQADYSYQMPSFYLGRLNILPNSETVRVNQQKLKRGVDYMMIYEVGSVEVFKELDEYDEITIDYEYMPFGGQFQQTIAGLWAEYSYKPRQKKKPEEKKEQTDKSSIDSYSGMDRAIESMSPFSQSMDRSGYGGDYDVQSRYQDSYNYSSYYGDYSSSSNYGGRRGRYGSFDTGRSRSTPMRGGYYGMAGAEGLNLSFGYIYNTGQRASAIPDVNSAPSRLQAMVFSGNWGQRFNLARFFGILPFVELRGEVPLSLNLDGEAAYSRNNPNSVGYALIDSMEGAKESSRLPTYKFSWKVGGIPVASDEGIEVDNRAVFHIARRDKDESHGNYMKNREASAVEINPLSRATQQHLVMEIGYELDESQSWGGLSYSVSPTGADYSDYESLEMWIKVDGDDNVNLHLDFGTVSEDADNDFRLDSEDLPRDLIDQNGDHKVDILDLSKDKLPEEHKYKGNGRLDLREDTGWVYNDFGGTELANVGEDNTVLDTEDLDGDVVLDTSDSYFEFTIPLNAIPVEWVRKRTRDTGWLFLSIPLESAQSNGRSPSWAVVKHARIWLEKTAPGAVAGKFQWYSILVAGNRWERGLVVDKAGKLSTDNQNQMVVGTKNNQEFEDYLEAYREIENDKEFEALHPYVESSFSYGDERKEQALTINYNLQPETTGYTMRELSGQLRGDGQDFSKHRNIRLWLYGDGSKAVFIMRLGSNVDDFGAGSPVTKRETTDQGQYPGYSSYTSYYSYSSSYGGRGYYEYSKTVDFTGWRLITISLEDADNDGHPDALKPVNQPSITNIGQVLVGLKNDLQFPINGEIWVNEIHLSDPYVKTGWARRFNFSTELADIYSLRAGYARQDRDFENSAGQTGRTSMMSMGYSTSNYDYNIDNDVKLISWLPVSFTISHRESESRRQLGMISSYESGLTKIDNKTLSVSFDKNPFPDLSLSYDKQREWNELRGLEISDLYSSDLGYSLGRALSLRLNYAHEVSAVEREESDEASTMSSYYYGRNQDSIVDSGGISLQITPSQSFGINPTYDVRRELERETGKSGSNTKNDTEGEFTISSRDQRLSLNPTLRKFFGIRPSINGRFGFTEDWFRGEKDASMNADFNVGIDITLKDWFDSTRKKASKKADKKDDKKDDKESGSDNVMLKSESDSVDSFTGQEESFDESLNREELGEMMEERFQDGRGNWIESQKDSLKGKIKSRSKGEEEKKKGVLRRSIESFTFRTDYRYDVDDYLRQLQHGMGFVDILKLDPESEYRTRTTNSSRLSVRSGLDPLTWMSLGSDMSFTKRFSKSAGTAANSNSSTIGGDVKFFNSKNSTSVMLKYDMTVQDSGNRSGSISDSVSHNQSVMVRKSWQSGVGSSLGVRTTLRNYERGGVKTNSTIVSPNFNIDYDLQVKGQMGIPLIGKTISLDHNLDVSNTFSSVIRRERLGVNRDEKSEQYGASLDVSYDLREKIRSTLRLSVDYNHDRVEEGADYITISGSLMVRGEIR